ncbi:MAG: hypothetical protein AAGD33_10810, partial [Actinomycetota bacterium]
RRSDVEQLVLEPTTAITSGAVGAAVVDVVAERVEPVQAAESPDPVEPEPWMPQFDHSDDLDGLLSARSPLLARAFRGDECPR